MFVNNFCGAQAITGPLHDKITTQVEFQPTETRPGLQLLLIACSLYFTRILLFDQAQNSARENGLKLNHHNFM